MKNSLSLTEAKKALENKEISSEEIVKDTLSAIEKKDPEIHAYLRLNENALNEAKKADSSEKKLPLAGVPIAIKDNFLTKGLITTASSSVLENYIPQYDATVVKKLKNAGAIVIGKTNMDAWAHGSSTETSDFGITKNPWDLSRLPGGSSGGSGAAVSADMCLAAIGSETAGSVRGPAAWCGIVGLKPTYGRVSRYGVIAMGSSLDSPGPMTKSVSDAAILLEIIAGEDTNDSTTSPKNAEKYTSFLNKGVSGMKIAIAEDYLLPEMDKRVKEKIIQTAKVLEDLGADVDYVSTMDPRLAIGVYTIVQRSEVSSNLARYDGIRYGNKRDAFGEEAKRRIMLGTFALSAGYADKYYKKAQKVRSLFIKDFERIFATFDLLLAPTLPGPAPKIGVTEGQAMFGEMADMLAEPSSVAGLPGISIPCGFVDDLPVGLNIMGPQFAEGKVIQAAAAYEEVTEWHKIKPEMVADNR